MICETFDIKNENSQEYARLNTYLISHSDSIKTETRPLIILCPGGGYWFTSEREGEMLALQFVAAGFHAAILWYSVKPATFSYRTAGTCQKCRTGSETCEGMVCRSG